MEDLNQFVPNVHFEKIPIKNLVSNQKYQRNLSQSHIARAAANFDLYQINPVKVSRRDGVNYVFNGQHTIEIVALVSGSRDTPVWCMIYEELVYEHEADIFANQQKFVKPLSPYEVFLAMTEVILLAQCNGANAGKVAQLEEYVARALSINWHEYDRPGDFKW